MYNHTLALCEWCGLFGIKPGDTTLDEFKFRRTFNSWCKTSSICKWFNALHYEGETGLIDYNSVEKLAIENKLKL